MAKLWIPAGRVVAIGLILGFGAPTLWANPSGTWAGSINCSYGSGSLNLNIDANGAVSGGVTNGSVQSGIARGSSISFTTSNFFGNLATFSGSIRGSSMSGTYTQSYNSETCSWQASRTGGAVAARPEPTREAPKQQASVPRSPAKSQPSKAGKPPDASRKSVRQIVQKTAVELGETAIEVADKIGKQVPKFLKALGVALKAQGPASTVKDAMYVDFLLNPEVARPVKPGWQALWHDRKRHGGMIKSRKEHDRLQKVMDEMEQEHQPPTAAP